MKTCKWVSRMLTILLTAIMCTMFGLQGNAFAFGACTFCSGVIAAKTVGAAPACMIFELARGNDKKAIDCFTSLDTLAEWIAGPDGQDFCACLVGQCSALAQGQAIGCI